MEATMQWDSPSNDFAAQQHLSIDSGGMSDANDHHGYFCILS